jgi:hypothetical protein
MRGKPKGLPKSGGRIKGVPNRKTEELQDKCLRLNIDPFERLLILANHENDAIALGALKEVCQYLYPKRKALEHSGEINNPYSEMSYDELKQAVLAKLGGDEK